MAALSQTHLCSARSAPGSITRCLFDYAISFNLNEPSRINEARYLNKRACWPNVAKEFTMRASSIAPMADIYQHDPGPNDVRHSRSRFSDSLVDDFKAADRLRINVAYCRSATVG